MPAMNHLNRIRHLWILPFAALVSWAGPAAVAADTRPPKEPARIAISVSPESLAAGGTATVTVKLEPKDGIKINRYPRIKLVVPEQDAVAAESSASVGNDAPPPPEKLATGANYYDEVDLLELELPISGSAASGKHDIEGKLTYFYCVTASGMCAPARVPVSIPVEVSR
jgi:hypothetical protein